MGFSTSGAVAVMLIAVLVAASVLVPTLFSISAQTGEAFSTSADQLRDQQNTDLEIQSVEYRYNESEDVDTDGSVNVTVTNEGSQTLDLRDTDLLVNGQYERLSQADTAINRSGEESTSETNIWPPGTDLEIGLEEPENADVTFDDDGDELERVKIVAPTGVSDGTSDVEAIDLWGEAN